MQHQDTTNEKCMYSPQSGHSSIHGCEKLWLAGSKSRPLYNIGNSSWHCCWKTWKIFQQISFYVDEGSYR